MPKSNSAPRPKRRWTLLSGRDRDGNRERKDLPTFLMTVAGPVPWMARTVHRLYDAQGQKILDRENLAIAHWYYLRVLAERGELNDIGTQQARGHCIHNRSACAG